MTRSPSSPLGSRPSRPCWWSTRANTSCLASPRWSAPFGRAPAVRVLATSRRPLAVAGETAWAVPPLGVAAPDTESFEVLAASPAVQLFCERAQAVRPDFELNRDNAADVANRLALDGLPLAIELAAARPTCSRLTPRSNGCTTASISWSKARPTLQSVSKAPAEPSTGASTLTAEQRRFFARLASFSGGFDLEAVEHVASEADRMRSHCCPLSSAIRWWSRTGPAGTGCSTRSAPTPRNFLLGSTQTRHAAGTPSSSPVSPNGWSGSSADPIRPRLSGASARTSRTFASIEWSLAVGDLDLAARPAGSLAWFWILDGRLDVADRHLRRAATMAASPRPSAPRCSAGTHSWLRASATSTRL